MCLFKYREKRYGKLTLILVSLLFMAIGAAAVLGGIYAQHNMQHWAKYVIVAVAGVVALVLVLFGLFMFFLSFSMINQSKSVRDENKSKGIANKRLCDKCGRVITKNAEFCEHCGAKQQTGLGLKKCPTCKTENSGTAKFCEKCGYEFKDEKEGF